MSRDGVRSHVAIKVIPTWDEAGEPSQRLREVARQEALDHCRWMARLRTSILPVRAVQEDSQAGCVRIVTDLYDSTLAQWMKKRPDGRPLVHEWVRRAHSPRCSITRPADLHHHQLLAVEMSMRPTHACTGSGHRT